MQHNGSGTDHLTAVSVLMRQLEHEGVTHVFGIPGGPLMPLYEAMFDSGQVRPIIAKHEEGAAFMAEGYARVSGRLGVCCATTGPGATNALTGVACAQRDSIPVMLITAQVAMSVFGKGAAQESSVQGLDIVDMYRAATKSSLLLLSPQRMEETAHFLMRRAMTGRRGPVHLSLPADLVKQSVNPPAEHEGFYRVQERSFDRESVKAASELLVRAHRPALLAGYGVHLSRAYTELRQLAEQLAIPVATTPKAKGAFPEDHALSLGVLGFAGSPQADAWCLDDATDVLVVVGSSLGELATHCWNPRFAPRDALIHVDIDPTEIGKNYPVDVGVVGDAKTVLAELGYQIGRDRQWIDSPGRAERAEEIAQLKREHNRFVEPEGFTDDSSPMGPQRLVREIERAMPPQGLLFVDIGNVMAWALHYYQVRQPGTFHINLGLASMGHAMPASIGAKVAAPHRPVVSLVGDAAFAMNGMEIHTAVEHQIPVVCVVMNNGGHGMVCHGERLQFKGKFQTGKFHRPLEIAAIAQGLGARSLQVDAPGDFAEAFRQALSAGEPVVLDVQTDPEAMPPMGMRIETLDKFFEPAAEAEAAPASSSEPEVVVTADANDLPPPRGDRVRTAPRASGPGTAGPT